MIWILLFHFSKIHKKLFKKLIIDCTREMKIKNAFFDKLHSLHFKQNIQILDLDKLDTYEDWANKRVFPFSTNMLNNSIKNKEIKKIHEIKKPKYKNIILKVLMIINDKIEEFFIIKGNDKLKIPDMFYIEFLLTNKLMNDKQTKYYYNYSFKDLISENNLENTDQDNLLFLDQFLNHSNSWKRKIDNNKEFYNEKENELIKNHKNHIMSIIYEYRYIKGTNGEKELVPLETIISKKLSCKNIYKLFDYFKINLNYKNFCKDYLLFKHGKKNKNEKIICYIFKNHKNSYFNLLNDDLKRIICSFL